MAQVTVTINGRGYQIACDDGQEEHLVELARHVDARVSELGATIGQVGDIRLLIMASLLIADELADARKAFEAEQRRPAALSLEAEAALAHSIEMLAARIEDIAARLEAA